MHACMYLYREILWHGAVLRVEIYSDVVVVAAAASIYFPPFDLRQEYIFLRFADKTRRCFFFQLINA